MNTASVFLGLSLGGAMFAASKAMQQTTRMWKRHGTITAYAISMCSTAPSYTHEHSKGHGYMRMFAT